MAPISPGVPSGLHRKKKKPALTTTTKLYRYEPFTKRISRLKIDPVHTVDRRKPSNNEADLTQSFFRTALDEWAELNLSQTFTSFLNKASPLSENLPQLLHHADTIFDLLVQHIEKKDALALEPLLSLLAHLAHDLGQRFEEYFSRTVVLVAQVAAAHDSAEVIEWCFTCLAWMFKYLSRLLVQDLRPLLDIMTPYLSAKKDYIVRFSAESLAFLLRKAAVLYQKRTGPLNLAMKHLLGGLVQEEGSTQLRSFQFGVMSLCVESSQGMDRQLHSSAGSLLRALLDAATPFTGEAAVRSTVEGIVIALIHDTNGPGFQPALDIILDYVRERAISSESSQVLFALRLLTVVIGTRRGSRISSWTAVMHVFHDIAQTAVRSANEESQINRDFIAISAAVFQYAPMDQLLPFSQKLLDFLTTQFSGREFFAFCTICAELGTERFTDLVLPRLQQFIVKNWRDDEVGIYYLLEKLREDGIIAGGRGSAGSLECPDFEASIVQKLAAEDINLPVEQFAGRVHLPANLRLSSNSKFTTALLDTYRELIAGVLKGSSTVVTLRQRVLLGWGFETYIDFLPRGDTGIQELVSLVLNTSPAYYRLPSFLQATIRLLQKDGTSAEAQGRSLNESVRYVLVQNMLSPSFALKEASLKILTLLAPVDVKEWLSEATDVMLEVLKTPYTPADVRKIAMLLRRLPQRQHKLGSDSSYQDLIPFFCLGMLSYYHDQTRKEVCNVLAQMVEHPAVEDSIVNTAIQWLQTPPAIRHAQDAKSEQEFQKSSDFECTNLHHIDSLCAKIHDDINESDKRLHALVEHTHQFENTRTPESGRTLALQVLSAIPASAERRSRLLVPIFLTAPMNRGQLQQKAVSESSTSSHTLSPDVDDHEWSLADRKALLTLLGKFVNPRVLFRSGEVYDKLVDLLSNGNTEIRKLALQAVLAWKDPSLIRHQNTLVEVAEDKVSTTDLGTLLSAEDDQSTIKQDDRSAVFPALLRLVFGLIVGRAGTAGSQEARRRSILRTLFRMNQGEVAMFLDIALGKLREIKIADFGPEYVGHDAHGIPEDQQYGFLRLLLSMLEALQSRFAPYGPQVVDAVVFCLVKASRQSHAVAEPSASSSSLARSIRRTAFQSLVLLFEHCEGVGWPSYLPTLFANAISPRLETFSSETNQGISGLLRLFASWVHSNDLIGYLIEYDSRVPNVLWQCLTAPSAQTEVKAFILQEIVVPWVTMADDKLAVPNKAGEVLTTEADGLLKALLVLLENTPPREILNAVTTVLPKLAPFATSPESRRSTVSLLISLLRDSSNKVPPNVKGQLLASIHSFVASSGNVIDEKSRKDLYELTSSLFNYFKDQSNRQVLCEILDILSRSDSSLEKAAQFCRDLNASSTQRLEEIDYNTRLQAFHTINELEVGEQNKAIWRPVVFNLLFFIRTMDDFSIRSNAMSCLKQFVVKASEADSPDLHDLIRTVILTAVKKGIRHESELIRADFVALYGLLVQYARGDTELENMTVLLVGNDEEASFFANILHIQQHRRLRAIRRLVSEVEKGAISAQNNAEVFIPLLEMFVYESSTDESAQTTKGQSIAAMGTLLQWINWKHFKTLFRRYRNDIDATESTQKAAGRLLAHAADALLEARNHQSKSNTDSESVIPYLAKSIRDKDVVENELRSHFIPKLAELVHYKDETEISFRIPVAVTTIKLIKMLPAEEVQMLAPPIILDIAQILKTRTQESRDVARQALCQIVTLLGSSSLQFVLKEMRSALTRGYQLHVVSYTLHSILVALTPHTELGDLDYCVDDLVLVIMDDIFGAVGQEKDNQDYISSMKEVKSSKSYDSMELLARSTSVGALSKLVAPIQTILSGTLTSKQVKQVDELLRRLGVGVSQNPSASKRELLVFSYQLFQSLYKEREINLKPIRSQTLEEKSRQRYLIQLNSTNKATSGQTSPLLYKLARFALDLVRSTVQKHDDILTPENVHGFLPIIGDAMIEGQEDVKISALRLLSAIIKLPMDELDQNAPLYVREAVNLVKNATSTNEEAAQAALKFVAAVLRERKSVQIRDSDIADLLHRITPDIEEPDRQGITFNFIRAVMARKMQLPEVYELVDKIGIMMVTNQAKAARDLARGVYVHFLLVYPQSSTRWTKQQKFLLKNLEYTYPEGRQSVMEAVNTLVAKVKGELGQELISTFFIPVVLRMANDDNKGCRELAGALLGQIFRLADRTHLREMLEPLRSWAEQEDNQALQKVSLQAYSILVAPGVALDPDEIVHMRDSLAKILQSSVTEDGDEWERLFQSLLLLSRLVDTHPGTVLSSKQARLWSSVWKLLSHANVWIQSTCASLIHDFFQHCGSADLTKLPLVCDHGLRVGREDFLQILRASVRIVRRTQGKDNLSASAVQNLVFMCQCMDVNGLTMEVADKGDTPHNERAGESDEDSDPDQAATTKTRQIPAIHYLLDQMSRILRIETSNFTSAALSPKTWALKLLSTVLPGLSEASLVGHKVHDILLPLQHLTDPNTIQPRSADPTFASTYQTLIELAHEVIDKVQAKLGDTQYVKVLTEVSKMVRERREQRRTKRRIERVAEPERAAQEKRRKSERKRERKKEIGRTYQKRRQEMGM